MDKENRPEDLSPELDDLEGYMLEHIGETLTDDQESKEALPESEEESSDKPLTISKEDSLEGEKPEEETSGEDTIGDPIQKESPRKTNKLPGIFASELFWDNVIRIVAGLIFLTVSLMPFVPKAVSLILAAFAVAFCGLPVFLNAATDLKKRNILSENVLVSLASILTIPFGFAYDGVFALIIADLGFLARDVLLERVSSEALEDGETSLLNDRFLLNRTVKLVNALISPVLLLVAVVIMIIMLILHTDSSAAWIHRALVILAAAAPCAVTLITAITYDYGKKRGKNANILFSDVKSLSATSRLTSFIFNRTGAITDGQYRVTGIYPVRLTDSQLLYLAAYAEAYSDHPLAQAITAYSGITVDRERIEEHREEKGLGTIIKLVSSEVIAAGNLDLMEQLGVRGDMIPGTGISVYVAVGKTFVGRIDFSDSLKDGARECISRLKKEGIVNIALMTGDNTLSATSIGREVGITEVYADCLPKDKYERVRYIAGSQQPDEKLAFVCAPFGDDSAADLADVKMILGPTEKGRSGQVVIPSGYVNAIPDALAEAQKTERKVRQNTVILFSVKLLSVVMALLGFFGIYAVLLADIVATLAAGYNAVGYIKIK